MTTTEFYHLAQLAAKERGLPNSDITTISGCYDGKLLHSCQLWFAQKSKHIRSGMHPNPVSAIIAFKDAIDFELKEYNAMIEDVQLNELPKNSVANKSNNFNCPNGCGINGDLGTCSICIGK